MPAGITAVKRLEAALRTFATSSMHQCRSALVSSIPIEVVPTIEEPCLKRIQSYLTKYLIRYSDLGSWRPKHKTSDSLRFMSQPFCNQKLISRQHAVKYHNSSLGTVRASPLATKAVKEPLKNTTSKMTRSRYDQENRF